MISKISNHLFYRIYWWNVTIVKEKDLPLFSTLLGISIIHILNFSVVVFAFLIFVLENVQSYPKWLHITFMILIFFIDYFIFIYKGKYKKLISKEDRPNKTIKKLDYLVSLYLISIFIALGYTIIKGREMII